MESECDITVTVNGTLHSRTVSARTLLVDFIRNDLGLTGTHDGCDHGVCGSCTVQMNGEAVRSCLTFAVQADGAEIETVEAFSAGKELHPIQKAFMQEHGLQCGFCTPGILVTVREFLSQHKNPSEQEIRHALSGNLCRCTGYQNIIKAVMTADRIWER
jgi:carbon-monoxide dehydrogenase small subunit